MRELKGNTAGSRCVDGNSIIQDNVKIFDQKYQEVLDKSECPAQSVASAPMFHRINFSLL